MKNKEINSIDGVRMKISIIIPFHNEEKLAEKAIKKTNGALSKENLNYEIIAVNDNSDDNTEAIISNLARKNKKIKLVNKRSKKRGPTGLGSALIFGFNNSSGDVLIPFMGDLSDNPSDIPKLIKKIKEGYDVVCGSRFVNGGYVKDYPSVKLVINRLWNNVFSFLFGMKIKDISNAFKAYKKEVIETVKPNSKGFEITAEVLLKAHIEGFKITEVPVSWYGRKYGESKFISTSFFSQLKKIPRIGYSYGSLGIKLWFTFLVKKFNL